MNDGTKECYLHRMDDSEYETLCEGKEGKVREYNIGEQVEDTGFLSDDGSDRVCKRKPMFMIRPDKDQDQDGSSRRGLKGNKRGCDVKCGVKCDGWNCTWKCELLC